MSQSKTDKSRKAKVDQFKTAAKEKAEQEATPKTQMFPTLKWEPKDTLDLPGHLLDALEGSLVQVAFHLNKANSEFSNVGKVMQMLAQTNIKAKKIEVTYKWNNGEVATDAEVANYQTQMEAVQQQQADFLENMKKAQNAEKTGLVGLDGEPLGTTQDLTPDEEMDERKLETMVDESYAAGQQQDNEEGRV